MVCKVQGRRTSHRIRDHCWVTRAAECSSQQDLGTADSQHPPILPCSTLHLFSLEIIHTAFMVFKIHETIQNWHQISWVFCQLATAGQESVITLHQHCLWVQHVPRGRRVSLHLQFTLAHCLASTHSTMLPTHQSSTHPGAKKSMFHLLLPSALSFLAVSWTNVSIEGYLTTTKLFMSTTTEHTQSILLQSQEERESRQCGGTCGRCKFPSDAHFGEQQHHCPAAPRAALSSCWELQGESAPALL